MDDTTLWRKSWQDEVDANFLYQVLIDKAPTEKALKLYTELGQCEAEHIDAWENLMQEHQMKPGKRVPSTKASILAWIGRRYHVGFLQEYMAKWEGREVQEYSASDTDRFQQEYRLLTKDGEVRWVDDRTMVERNEEGQIAFYQGIFIE